MTVFMNVLLKNHMILAIQNVINFTWFMFLCQDPGYVIKNKMITKIH